MCLWPLVAIPQVLPGLIFFEAFPSGMKNILIQLSVEILYDWIMIRLEIQKKNHRNTIGLKN